MCETYILSIESSCDDTSAAVFNNNTILSNVIYNQKVHEEYGGVVPELASRKHHQKILPVVKEALKKAGITKNDLSAVAVTKGPGLMGSLLVGVSFAKSMAAALNIPIIEVNHMQAHILAHFIDDPKPFFPFLCLTVSGGHTQIVVVKDHLDMELIGTTIDDAAGEAFDKSGKMLGLSYPAGPHIDKLAAQGKAVFTFSKPKVELYQFSFSGLKTSILYFVKKEVDKNPNFITDNLVDLCASIQSTIIDILMDKIEKASADYGIKEVAIAGGVSANSGLRKALSLRRESLGWNVFIPDLKYCTDNAGMIGITAYYKFLKKDFSTYDMAPEPRMKF
ncbi:MAG: tRNA (adenosine(37)-N6)-threonylcarbamoyltransferase complex transferase subunit TsaD [Saprospiraceae bacterium]